ncbi:Box C/D snoRNA protein 1 [Zancudomyces culisetae]|uniref:Box C/D snoRNA protein 1 n=1 Tax=Zancudomyces culisetae TaxID=1213189 RepID=A0A1R1PJY1_ZANCU|nr:Box C/D snoRNA protein 1 [Zancudomyces culisetae]|eukprot:OMH81271.1 Box C/D snoRNA protein 1 [Zancudomyces culisetae]
MQCLFSGLACVKRHKEDYGCSGERDKSKFVKLKEYDLNNLMQDIHYIQELKRVRDNVERSDLIDESSKKRKQTFFWTLEIIIRRKDQTDTNHSDNTTIKIFENSVPDDTKIEKIWNCYRNTIKDNPIEKTTKKCEGNSKTGVELSDKCVNSNIELVTLQKDSIPLPKTTVGKLKALGDPNFASSLSLEEMEKIKNFADSCGDSIDNVGFYISLPFTKSKTVNKIIDKRNPLFPEVNTEIDIDAIRAITVPPTAKPSAFPIISLTKLWPFPSNNTETDRTDSENPLITASDSIGSNANMAPP